jgi:hypothetical protein
MWVLPRATRRPRVADAVLSIRIGHSALAIRIGHSAARHCSRTTDCRMGRARVTLPDHSQLVAAAFPRLVTSVAHIAAIDIFAANQFRSANQFRDEGATSSGPETREEAARLAAFLQCLGQKCPPAADAAWTTVYIDRGDALPSIDSRNSCLVADRGFARSTASCGAYPTPFLPRQTRRGCGPGCRGTPSQSVCESGGPGPRRC